VREDGLARGPLPASVVLCEQPDGCLSSQYALTVGRRYATHGRMGSCLVVATDRAGETGSVHWSRFSTHTEPVLEGA